MKNQKQTIRKIVGVLSNADEEGGFWLPNNRVQRNWLRLLIPAGLAIKRQFMPENSRKFALNVATPIDECVRTW